MTFFATGNNSIDALVYSSWNKLPGTALNLSYSFLNVLPADAASEDANGFAPMNSQQRDAARAALAKWAAVANITFTEVGGGGQIQLGTNDQGSRSSAYAYLPEPGVATTALYLNNRASSSNNLADGSYGATVLLHELGHTLGLKHPGDYDSGGNTIGGPYLPPSTDTVDYTQMSYNPGLSSSKTGKYASTPMLYDIQAMQYLYGANMGYRTGNDVYAVSAAQPAMCIWDAGGSDTLDFSACTSRIVIDLRAGQFSETAPGLHNIAIAYSVTLENAIAGSGGSTIYANGAGNAITGGNGADEVYQGAGSDRIEGGLGTDTVVYNQAFSQYTLLRREGSVTVSGEGNDVLSNVELLRFSDRTVAVADLPISPIVTSGTAGPDRLHAGPGSETFDGGAGLDTVVFGGLRQNYSVLANGNGFQVTDRAGNGGTDSLAGVERAVFDNGAALALDTAGVAGLMYRLYLSTYGRGPDEAGFGYWLKVHDNGGPMRDIATAFITSQEFLDLYGRNLSNENYVDQVYQNILHRKPDEGGRLYYLDLLAHGVSREEVLLSVTDSLELRASLVGVMPDAIPYQVYA